MTSLLRDDIVINNQKLIEVARFMSNREDVFRHGGIPAKGECAERMQILKLFSWVHGEIPCNCHQPGRIFSWWSAIRYIPQVRV